MGLTIHYTIETPKSWSWDQTLAKLQAVHAFASDLSIAGIDDDIDILDGDRTDFNKQDDPDARWDAIKTYRHINSPWQPGSSTTQNADRCAQFAVNVAEGSEWLYIGVAEYPDNVWEARPLERDSHGRLPYIPNWLGALTDKSGFYGKESKKIIRDFMKKYQLKKCHKGRKFYNSSSPSWQGATWHEVTVDNYNSLITVGETRTRYLSHRKGWADNAAVVYFDDPARGYSSPKLCLEFTCPLDRAKEIATSTAFKRDLKRLATGCKSVTPGGREYRGFCKTHYAVMAEYGGLPNFLQAHLSTVAIFDKMIELGFKVEVSDEGDFWENRDLQKLSVEINQQAAMVAAFGGFLKDALGGKGDGVEVQGAGFGSSDFERLEFEGQKHMNMDAMKNIVKICHDLVKDNSTGEKSA